MTSPRYAALHRTTYDLLAPEYANRQTADEPRDTELMEPFFELLEARYGHNLSLELIDVGCGNGLNLRMMQRAGHRPTGIDISPEMLKVAEKTCPSATLIEGEFIATPLNSSFYHGIFAKAIFHLFTEDDAHRFLEKVSKIIAPGGIFYLTTTSEEKTQEGLETKTDYAGKFTRFRRRWKECDLTEFIARHGFAIELQNYNYESDRGKQWINFWLSLPQ